MNDRRLHFVRFLKDQLIYFVVFFFKQKTAYEIDMLLEFRRVLFRSSCASQVTVDHVGWKYRPEGVTSAQLNLPFCVATLLLEGDVFVDQFSESMLANPARMSLAEKVKVVSDPDITSKGSAQRHLVKVELFLKDG